MCTSYCADKTIIKNKNTKGSITVSSLDAAIVFEGSTRSVILKEIEIFGADLIVFGSHGCEVLEGFILGSISQSVALYAKCSVEIVRK